MPDKIDSMRIDLTVDEVVAWIEKDTPLPKRNSLKALELRQKRALETWKEVDAKEFEARLGSMWKNYWRNQDDDDE